jgi:hypothetical protein
VNAIHLLRAPPLPPAPVAWPPPTVTSPVPGPTESWVPPLPPPVETPIPEARRSRRGLILPLVAAAVLAVGLSVAIGGLAAKGSAERSARTATEQLATVTDERDAAVTSLADATTSLDEERATLAAGTAEAQAMAAVTPALVVAADGLLSTSEAQATAEAEYEVALASGDYDALVRSIDVYNAAVVQANGVVDAYYAAMMQILLVADLDPVLTPA